MTQRTRDWRRHQRERIRSNRRDLFMSLWSWSSADHVANSWPRWSKVNPGTACSCAMCSDPHRKPDPAPEIAFRIRPGLYASEQ